MIRRALIIGTNRYRFLPVLSAATSDAAGFAQIVEDPVFGGYENEYSMDDEALAMSNKIERFFLQASEEDTLLLYFVGHGLATEDTTLLLAGTDTTPAGEHGVSVSWLRDAMLQSRAQSISAIVDCCFGRGLISAFDDLSLRSCSSAFTRSTTKSIAMLCGADATGRSLIQNFHPQLTRAIMLGISNGLAGGTKPHLTVADLADFVATLGLISRRQFGAHFKSFGQGPPGIVSQNPHRGTPLPLGTIDDLLSEDLPSQERALRRLLRLLTTGLTNERYRAHEVLGFFLRHHRVLPPALRRLIEEAGLEQVRGRTADTGRILIVHNTRNLFWADDLYRSWSDVDSSVLPVLWNLDESQLRIAELFEPDSKVVWIADPELCEHMPSRMPELLTFA